MFNRELGMFQKKKWELDKKGVEKGERGLYSRRNYVDGWVDRPVDR